MYPLRKRRGFSLRGLGRENFRAHYGAPCEDGTSPDVPRCVDVRAGLVAARNASEGGLVGPVAAFPPPPKGGGFHAEFPMKSCLLWAAALALALSPMRAHAGSTKLNPNLLYQEQYSGAPTPDVLPTETHVTANSTSIGTLTTGVATNASGITAEVAARQTAVSAEATARAAAVTAEQTRAEAAEGTISGTAATNTSAITAETTRAETAEGVNASGLTAEVAARQTAISGEATARTAAVSAETTRAEGVEGTLTTGVSANAANITAETTARQTAVTGEATARTAAIGVETTRAEGAESTLTTAAAAAQTTANAAFPTISAGPLATQAGANSAAAIVGAIGAVHNVTASGSYTVLGTDLYVCINKATPAATVVFLPSAFNQSNLLNVKDCAGNAATYPITLTPASGTIDGNATVVMSVNYEALTLSYNGTGWSIW
jgi:hypothetical protein